MRDESSTALNGSDGNLDDHTTEIRHNAGVPRTQSQLSALVNEELGVSEWIPIDQFSINAFADVTGD